MDAKHSQAARYKRFFLILAVLFLLFYVLVPQLGSFRDSWRHIYDANTGWLAVAVGLTFCTYFAAAGTYYFLAFKPLPYLELIPVQLAAMCVNKLLPAGVGALGSNYAYLRHMRHNPAQAGIVAAVNNVLGVSGHFSLLILVYILSAGKQGSEVLRAQSGHIRAGAIAAFTLLVVLLAVYVFMRRRLIKFVKDVAAQLISYRSRPHKLAAAYLSSISLTLLNVFCLMACLNALDLHLSLFSSLVVFSFGIGLGTAVPTPGGLGGFEAGLASSLVVYHVPAVSALAAALLYRLVSYWLPLIFGAIAFVYCQRRQLFKIT